MPTIDFIGNDELESSLVNKINTFVTSIKAARNERETEWDSYYKIWKSKEDKGTEKSSPYTGRAKTYAPFGHRAVEVFASRVPSIIFDKEDVVKIIDARDKTPEGQLRGELNTQKLNKQFKANRQRTKWTQFIRNGAIYGTAVAAVNWRLDTKEVFYDEFVPKVDEDGFPIDNQYDRIPRVREADVYDDPDMRVLDIKKFFIDPTVRTIDDAPFVVEETTASYNQLLRLAKNNVYNMGRVKKLKSEGSVESQNGSDHHIEYDERYDTTGFASIDFSEQPLKVYEFWGMFEIKPGMEVEIVGTVVNNEVIRFKRNPFYHQKKPFVAMKYIEDDQSFYGVSMLEAVRLEILAANTIKNQMIDRSTQNLNNMWLRHKGSGINRTQLKFRPNGIIDTNIMEGLKPLRANEESMRDGLNMIQYLDQSVQQTTGATSLLAGTETDLLKNSTAFAIKSNKTESTVKFAAILDSIVDNAVRPYFEMVQDLNAQFCEIEDSVEILGEMGQMIEYPVQPQDILSDYDIEVFAGEELVQESFEVQNIISYLNWVIQMIGVAQQFNPGQPIEVPNVMELADKVWHKLGFKEPLPKVPMQSPQLPPEQGGPAPQGGSPDELGQVAQQIPQG